MKHMLILVIALAVLGVVAFVAQPEPDPTCIGWQATWDSKDGRIVPGPDRCVSHATPAP